MNELVLIQKALRYLFYAFVVATVVLWCLAHYRGMSDQYWIICGLCAIGCSILRFVLRFML
jgi:hypothetical protein